MSVEGLLSFGENILQPTALLPDFGVYFTAVMRSIVAVLGLQCLLGKMEASRVQV